MAAEPTIITIAKRVVERRSYAYFDDRSGVEVEADHENAVLLDVQSANLLVQYYQLHPEVAELLNRVTKTTGIASVIRALWESI